MFVSLYITSAQFSWNRAEERRNGEIFIGENRGRIEVSGGKLDEDYFYSKH